jgi:hypothetical protein
VVIPPVEKKCEELAENCEANPTTQANVVGSDLAFTPVTGWTYAQGQDATVAQSSDSGPAVAMTTFEADTKDAKKDNANREASFDALLKQLGLSPLKKKAAWKKPDDTKQSGDLKINLWQLDGGVRATKKGQLLVIEVPAVNGKHLIGIGFVPDDDTTHADEAILKSIESIGPGKSK